MKKIHIRESKLNEIYDDSHELRAGTDHPYYENEETGELYFADWNGDYGFPFGFWPTDYNGTMQFVIGEPWTTHANACGKCAEQYFNDSMNEQIDDEAYQLSDAIETFVSDLQSYGYQYDEDNDLWVSADGSDEKDMDDFIEEIIDQVSGPVDIYKYVYGFLDGYLNEGNTNIPSSSDIYEYLSDSLSEGYDFSDQQGIDEAMKELGMDFYEYFEMGNTEGRMWPEKEMIGFYESEQPTPERLEEVLYELQSLTDLKVEDMLQYHIVFEDWRNDGTITACTVQDYIDGNYGPESYDDLDDEDDTPIQYNNGQKTVFVPHLANQQQKFDYYRDFRNTRDRAVYAPQERAAGNLAAYHAMRYPYGESKDKVGKIIREEIDNIIKMGD